MFVVFRVGCKANVAKTENTDKVVTSEGDKKGSFLWWLMRAHKHILLPSYLLSRYFKELQCKRCCRLYLIADIFILSLKIWIIWGCPSGVKVNLLKVFFGFFVQTLCSKEINISFTLIFMLVALHGNLSVGKVSWIKVYFSVSRPLDQFSIDVTVGIVNLHNYSLWCCCSPGTSYL